MDSLCKIELMLTDQELIALGYSVSSGIQQAEKTRELLIKEWIVSLNEKIFQAEKIRIP